MKHLSDLNCHVYECWQEYPESLEILFYSLKSTKDEICSTSCLLLKLKLYTTYKYKIVIKNMKGMKINIGHYIIKQINLMLYKKLSTHEIYFKNEPLENK